MPDLEKRTALTVWLSASSQKKVLHTLRTTMTEDTSSTVDMLIERGSLPIELESDIKDYMYLNHVESFTEAMQDLIRKGLRAVCKEGRGFQKNIDIQQNWMEFVE